MRFFSFEFVLLALSLSLSSFAQGPGKPNHSEQLKNEQLIQSNIFRKNRSLEDYGADLGENFRKAVSNLRSGETWLDLGAGNSIALKEYLTLESIPGFHLPPLNERAKVIALGYRKPEKNILLDRKLKSVLELRPDAYREVIGDFNKIPLSQYKNANLATSDLGIMSYVDDFTYGWHKSLSTLAPDGKLFFSAPHYNLTFEGANDAFSPTLKYEPEYEEKMKQILSSIQQKLAPLKGAEVKELKSDGFSLNVEIHRTSGELETVTYENKKFISLSPPERIFIRSEKSSLLELKKRYQQEEDEFIHTGGKDCAVPYHHLLKAIARQRLVDYLNGVE